MTENPQDAYPVDPQGAENEQTEPGSPASATNTDGEAQQAATGFAGSTDGPDGTERPSQGARPAGDEQRHVDSARPAPYTADFAHSSQPSPAAHTGSGTEADRGHQAAPDRQGAPGSGWAEPGRQAPSPSHDSGSRAHSRYEDVQRGYQEPSGQHPHQYQGQQQYPIQQHPHTAARGYQVHGQQRDAFGAPAPGAPVYPFASSDSGFGHDGDGAAEGRGKRRGGTRLLIAGLAIGALVGGATGAGTFALIDGQTSGSGAGQSAGSQSITINDTDEVTPTSAVAAKAAPSVVTINVSGGQAAGSGSGVILSEDGYVLTNNHVVTLDGMLTDPSIQVTDNDGRIFSAEIVGTDPIYDLAVIKLSDASDLTPIDFADSSELNVGDVAVAIGAPLGLSGTVTDGIVSALNRSITVSSSAVPDDGGDGDEQEDGQSPFDFNLPGQQPEQNQSAASTISLAVIQTDAAINHGNSGGALVDDAGELIGINVAIAGTGSNQEESGSIGVGFAIPSNIAERIANEIIENGEATHGLLGASVRNATADASSPVVGALISELTPGGAAEAAGLRNGDIVTNLGGLPITSSTDLTAQVRALAAGETTEITVVRGSDTHTVEVTLGTYVP